VQIAPASRKAVAHRASISSTPPLEVSEAETKDRLSLFRRISRLKDDSASRLLGCDDGGFVPRRPIAAVVAALSNPRAAGVSNAGINCYAVRFYRHRMALS